MKQKQFLEKHSGKKSEAKEPVNSENPDSQQINASENKTEGTLSNSDAVNPVSEPEKKDTGDSQQ